MGAIAPLLLSCLAVASSLPSFQLGSDNLTSYQRMATAAWCQAQGLSSQEQLTECVESKAHIVDIPYSLVIDGELSSPELVCRQESFLVLQWTLNNTSTMITYLLEIRNHTEDDAWLPYNVTQSASATVTNLAAGIEYQVRVRAMAQDGWLGDPVETSWISTLNVDFQPMDVKNVRLTRLMWREGSPDLSLTVEWDPSVDRTCYYKVLYFSPDLKGRFPEVKEINKEFKTVVNKLQFNTNYTMAVISSDDLRRRESNKTWTWIITPTCLNVTNGNLSVCGPPEPINLTAVSVPLTDGNYNLHLTWKSSIPELLPDAQVVIVKRYVPSSNASWEQQLPGNVTEATFTKIDLGLNYLVKLKAISPGGVSEASTLYKQTHQNKNLDQESGRIFYIVGPVIIIILLMPLIFLIMYKKLKQNEHCSLYFEDTDKLPQTESKGDEPAELLECDEWETPNDCLELEEILGEGAFGIVRRGHLRNHLSLEKPLRQVAVKMLKDNASLEDEEHFLQEIKMMKTVGQHPNVVSIIGCCTFIPNLKLIVEFCALGDLQRYLRKGFAERSSPFLGQKQPKNKINQQIKYAELLLPIESIEYINSTKDSVVVNPMYFNNDSEEDKLVPEDKLLSSDLLSFARQIAIGMEFLATNRIVHRDLAARNILVSSSKCVKISDFGLSRDIYTQNIYHKKGAGKLPIKWMAIESLLHQVYTTQSDVWSFGILLWEIVTLGGNPYPSTPTSRVFKLLKKGYRMECPASCSPELYDIMISCWNVKPKDRPTFTALRNKLDNLLESLSPQQYLNLNVLEYESPVTTQSTIEDPSSDGSQSPGGSTLSLEDGVREQTIVTATHTEDVQDCSREF